MAKQKRQVCIMGSSFQKGADRYLPRLTPGQRLRVERDPGNAYHSNAISVWVFGQCLGYLPRGFADEVAPLMDAGQTILASKSRDPRFATSGVLVVEWETPDAPSPNAGTDQ